MSEVGTSSLLRAWLFPRELSACARRATPSSAWASPITSKTRRSMPPSSRPIQPARSWRRRWQFSRLPADPRSAPRRPDVWWDRRQFYKQRAGLRSRLRVHRALRQSWLRRPFGDLSRRQLTSGNPVERIIRDDTLPSLQRTTSWRRRPRLGCRDPHPLSSGRRRHPDSVPKHVWHRDFRQRKPLFRRAGRL